MEEETESRRARSSLTAVKVEFATLSPRVFLAGAGTKAAVLDARVLRLRLDQSADQPPTFPLNE